MRRIMRNALLLTGFVVVALLAVGAVPSYLGSGETHYLEATPTDEAGAAVNATAISARRFPYLTTAVTADDGRSEGYQRALGGYKTWFAHSPFDEFDALQRLDSEAVRDDGDRVLVTHEGDRYSVAIDTDGAGGDQQ